MDITQLKLNRFLLNFKLRLLKAKANYKSKETTTKAKAKAKTKAKDAKKTKNGHKSAKTQQILTKFETEAFQNISK